MSLAFIRWHSRASSSISDRQQAEVWTAVCAERKPGKAALNMRRAPHYCHNSVITVWGLTAHTHRRWDPDWNQFKWTCEQPMTEILDLQMLWWNELICGWKTKIVMQNPEKSRHETPERICKQKAEKGLNMTQRKQKCHQLIYTFTRAHSHTNQAPRRWENKLHLQHKRP